MRRPMRIKLTVTRVEIVVPFHTGMRFHLTQVGHVPHKGPDVGRILPGGKSPLFVDTWRRKNILSTWWEDVAR